MRIKIDCLFNNKKKRLILEINFDIICIVHGYVVKELLFFHLTHSYHTTLFSL